MNIKRAFLVLAAALLLPGLAMAGAPSPGTADFVVDITFIPNTGSPSTTASIDCENVEEPNSRSEDGLFNGDEAQFTMPSLSIGSAECVTTVSAVSGYSTAYTAGGDSAGTGGLTNCTFDTMTDGDNNTCGVVFTAKDVTFTVNKVWDISRVGGEILDPPYEITISCDKDVSDSVALPDAKVCDDKWCTFSASGTSDKSFSVDVDATGSHPHCWATESIADSSVEVDNDCSSTSIAVGESGSCTITNTVFFEGIPTLNQYGLAIMVLLMLGVGFVGFRRFV